MTDKMFTLFLLACAEGHLLDVKKRIDNNFYGEGDDEEMMEDNGRVKEIEHQIESIKQKLEAIEENEAWTPRPTPHVYGCPCGVCLGKRMGRDLITL